MKVLISGATGLVGSALARSFEADGHWVVSLTRSESGPTKIHWDPMTREIDREALSGFDAVVHLAGENIAAGRWTPEQKALIKDSRVRGTRLLAKTLAELAQPPRVLASASAIGFYGPRGDEILTEESPSGEGFLAEVCREWEHATEPMSQRGIPVVHLRFGVILSPKGGALRKMLLPFKLGLGGRIGDGKQYMSWIALDDTAAAIRHCLGEDALTGPINIVGPNPVTNEDFTKTLGHVLRRPTALPMPAFAARLAFGEMADELLLGSTRVQPARLLASGFPFAYPHLEDALRHLLDKPRAPESNPVGEPRA